MRLAVALLAALVLGGCAGNGGDNDNTTATTPTTTPSSTSPPTNIIVQTTSMEAPNPFRPRTTPTPSPTPTASPTTTSPTPTPSATPSPAPTGVEVIVDIHNSRFLPQQQTAAPGDTVTWKNADAASHSVVADGGAFESETLGSGASFSVVLPAGTYAYHCGIHPSMTGTLTVA